MSYSESPRTSYPRSYSHRIQHIEEGIIQSVRLVQIDGSRSKFGPITGGIIGFAIGRNIGAGSGQTAAKIAGTFLGSILGFTTQDALTRSRGFEIVVRLDNGDTVVIVQEDGVEFEEGERVGVITHPRHRASVVKRESNTYYF